MNDDATVNRPDLSQYLLPEEKQFVTGNFRGYFLTKRYNFIATVNSFPDISHLYFEADENWIKAIEGLEHVSNGDWIVPTQLTIFCFRELRLAAELLLSCCTTPGYSHLRTAIEAFAQAQKIVRVPALSKVWLNRDEDLAEYNKYFKAKIKDNLFPDSSGFPRLHAIWKMLCDAGPHANVTSVGVSSSTTSSDTNVHWQLEFFEVKLEEITKNLLLMMMCQLEMFKHTYNVFHERLSLHPDMLANLHSHLVDFAKLKAKYIPLVQI
jgi:hypothetical protein